MSVIEGSGRGRIHRWEGLVHGSVFAVGGPDSPQDEEAWPYEHIHGRADTSVAQHTLVLNNMCVNNLYNQKNI